MRRQVDSWGAIAEQMGVSISTVRRAWREKVEPGDNAIDRVAGDVIGDGVFTGLCDPDSIGVRP
jgi:transcriptional regulator with XRE-family HTH domain